MSKPSMRPSFREFVRPIPRAVAIAFLQAIGILPLPSRDLARKQTEIWGIIILYRPGKRPF
jgi:hypothetical protein